jgi:hypothetical protein
VTCKPGLHGSFRTECRTISLEGLGKYAAQASQHVKSMRGFCEHTPRRQGPTSTFAGWN